MSPALTHACAHRIMPPKTIRTKASASAPTDPPNPETPEKSLPSDSAVNTPRDVEESESDGIEQVISSPLSSDFVSEVDAMLTSVTSNGDAMIKLDIIKRQIRTHELRLAAKAKMDALKDSMYEDLNTRICAFVCSLITYAKSPAEIEALCSVRNASTISLVAYAHTLACHHIARKLTS